MPDETQLLVGVLGPVVLVRDGVSLTPKAAVLRALLGALTVVSPAALPPESLIATVWGGRPPRDTRATLQLAVCRLRHWLKESVGDLIAVSTGPDGYRLDLGTTTSDLTRFRVLTGGRDDTYETLAEAVQLWRGTPLANVPPQRTDPDMVAGLREEHAAAVRRCAVAAMAEGQAQHSVTLLRPLCRRDDLDEEAHALLIEALTASGQRAAALSEFDRIRRRLATGLGMEPGVQLRTTYQRLLGQSITVAAAHRHAPSLVVKAPAWRGPRPLVTLVGRDQDRASTARLLRQSRLVTIAGPGGVGKTALALDVARSAGELHPDGVAVAMLGVVTTEQDVSRKIGRVYGVTEDAFAEADARGEGALGTQRSLLVLDNCEHLLPELASLVYRLLAAAPHITVLATSRQPIGISGEVVWRLDPLRVPEGGRTVDPRTPAIQLFLRRAVEAVPSFTVDDTDVDRVSRICQRLDGLPLALELAAAQLRTLTLADLDERLAKELNVLSARVQRDDLRHSSLTAAFDWSYRLLDKAERRLLAQLSIFAGGFTLEEAEALCVRAAPSHSDVLPTLAALVERSLVQPYDTAEGRRYRLLHTVREFVRKRLVQTAQPSPRQREPGRRARTTVTRRRPA